MWDFFEPKDNQWYRWELNGASAFLQKNENTWRAFFKQVRFHNLDDGFGGPFLSETPNDDGVSIVVANGKKAALRPYFSGMPYLVTLRDNVKILPGAETCFDVMLPPLLRFELSPHEPPFAETMPFVLSRTWFGDSSAGVLCHSLPMHLLPRRNETDDVLLDTKNHIAEKYRDAQTLIHCELIVRNTSRSSVDVTRLAIYTDMLNVYEKNGRLETDEVLLDSLSDGNLKMSVRQGRRGQKKGYKKLSSNAGGAMSEVFIRRGVDFLKTMTKF